MTGGRGLRLLMSVDTVGGVWSYALDLASGLARRGVTTILAVLGPPPDAAQRAEAEEIAGLRLVLIDQPLEWMATSAEEIEASGAALAACAREAEADIVHLNTSGPAAKVRFGRPLVIACHSCLATWWRVMRAEPMPADFRWRTALVGRAYHAADALVSPSAWFAATTAAAYDLPAAPQVVHNARRSRVSTGEAPYAPAAFTAGRLWDEGKAAAVLDDAAALLPFPLVAAGSTLGPNGTKIDLRHMQTAGRLSAGQVASILTTQPIFVSAACYEPFGLSVLEAAQAGCALVLSDTPGFRELWDGAAVFVAPRDAAGFAAALEAVARDGQRRAALGLAARERAGRYDLDRQVEAMLATYHRVLGQTGRDAAA